jgi:hypothetical protein
MDKLYKLHVDQWPAAVDVTVRIVSEQGIYAVVEAVDANDEIIYPFANGRGDCKLSQDMWWYSQKIVRRSVLVDIDPLEQMQARFETLESALMDADNEAEFLTIATELTELKAAIDKMNGAADDYADGMRMSRNLSDTDF